MKPKSTGGIMRCSGLPDIARHIKTHKDLVGGLIYAILTIEMLELDQIRRDHCFLT